MRKPKAKPVQKIKPLYIYLAGGVMAMISGWFLRPVSDTAHSVVVLLCLGLCLFGIYRHFKS